MIEFFEEYGYHIVLVALGVLNAILSAKGKKTAAEKIKAKKEKLKAKIEKMTAKAEKEVAKLENLKEEEK